MGKTVYVSISDINNLQSDIMKFVDTWVHEKKTPIPLKEIVLNMTDNGVKNFTTIKALNSLLKKGYIRRAVTISNKSSFVQLRRV